MAGTDRAFDLPAATCPGCGYYLPPAKSWTPLTVAEHRVHHLDAAERVRDLRGEPTMRSDVEAMLAASRDYVAELRRALRAQRDLYLDVSARRYDLAERVNVLEALATWETSL